MQPCGGDQDIMPPTMGGGITQPIFGGGGGFVRGVDPGLISGPVVWRIVCPGLFFCGGGGGGCCQRPAHCTPDGTLMARVVPILCGGDADLAVKPLAERVWLRLPFLGALATLGLGGLGSMTQWVTMEGRPGGETHLMAVATTPMGTWGATIWLGTMAATGTSAIPFPTGAA
mmetsp:Transcript_100764/g.285634  ORF Transcript_100764/g.285634 Transcript_100764/m.285634 type:complete len:172 (-) Transcript_100764:1825-2340(-)